MTKSENSSNGTKGRDPCNGRLALVVSLVWTLGFIATPAHAFSLLGPYESWMEQTNDLRQPFDIGGPMPLGSGYRWNVPVITYGFDQSFLNFFGSNGVAAVEGAIRVINDLPPASALVLTNYPFDSEGINYVANYQGLHDLKSETLWLLLEHLGLASPARYTFVLRSWFPYLLGNPYSFEWFDGIIIPYYIVERNYDPETLSPSLFVNGTLYAAEAYSTGGMNYLLEFPVDPNAIAYTAVADDALEWQKAPGTFYTGLTFDDVGGLRYLLSTNNVRYETLLPGVKPIGRHANAIVDGAWRPGVDKITFVPHRVDPSAGRFVPMTIHYADAYVTNGIEVKQPVHRVVAQPDFIFCAGDASLEAGYFGTASRSSTTNWVNNATLNGNPTGAGPGVIPPPVKITFNKFGSQFANETNDESAYNYPES